VLFSTGLEPTIGEDDWWDGRKLLHKLKGDQGKGDDITKQGSSHKGQSGKCVMSVPGILALVWRAVPGQVEEQARFVSDLPLGKRRNPERSKSGDKFQEAGCG